MKVFFTALSMAFSIVGAVIGAGFITGAEIVRFFSSEYMLSSAVLLGLLLVAFLFFIMDQGRLCGSFKGVNMRVLGRFSPFFEWAMIVVSFISACGMTAALDAVIASALGVDERLPTLSIICLPLSLFVVKKGVKGVAIFNTLLVPVMIAVIAFACIGSFPLKGEVWVKSKIYLTLLYVAMNCFTSAPVIADLGKGRDRRTILLAAIISAAVISFNVYIIMRKISTGYGTDANLPLLSSLKSDRVFYIIFTVITLFGIVTTLVSSHYTLVLKIEGSCLNRTLNVVVLIVILVFSRVGFGRIVEYAYPAIAAVGVLYCVAVTSAELTVLFPSLKQIDKSRLFSVCKRKPFYNRNKPVHTRGKQAKQ